MHPRAAWAFIGAGFLLLIGGTMYMTRTQPNTHMPRTVSSVVIDGLSIPVAVADTPQERERGLSGRERLAPDTGMLFVFETLETPGFWMKDMRFSIDIIFADNSGVVGVVSNAAPESYPTAFYPSRPVRYALEVPAGFAAAHSIAEGSKFVVQ